MTTILKIFLKTIFILTILFIVVTIYALIFGQNSTYEFADWKLSRQFYGVIMQALPIVILLTHTGTIHHANSKSVNITIVATTVICSIASFFIMVSMLFTVGFITITNDTLLYRHKIKPSITIMKQNIGQGALGSDGHRIVKLQPYFKYWNKVTIIDTATIEKSEWNFVNHKMDMENGE